MSRLTLTLTYNLGGIAEGWTEDHYLRFKAFDSVASARCRAELDAAGSDNDRATEVVKDYLKKQFTDGKVLVERETLPAEPDDIDGFPTSVLMQLLELVSRSKFADPKVGRM